LDIKLHKRNGLDFYKSLRPNTPFAVVISAFPEFALDGFELNVADYLLKPVSFERFTGSVIRVKELIRLKSDSQLFYDSQADYFFIKSNNQIQKLKYEDILYIEGLSNYVLIYTERQKYLSYLTLNLITEKLPNQKFIRIHKSYIVPIDKVDAIKGNDVHIGGHCLPLGQSYKEAFMELIEQKLLKK
jgi:DNA-binding LytR/AlgR family response regulator